MKRRFALSFFALLLFAHTGGLYAGPAIEIPEPAFDFGRVCQNAKIAHTFWIKSTGDDTLRITKVVPGCGCTQAPLRDSTIAPGDSTNLEIFFSTKSFRGPVSKRPYLVTNASPEHIYVKISAVLLPEPDTVMPISLSPYNLDVSQFTERPRRKAKFLIQNKGDQDYELTLVDWSRQYFDVELPQKVKAGETVEGLVIVHQDKINSEFEQSLTFEINDEKHTRYTLPVKRMYRIKKRTDTSKISSK
ncbi:MAG: DUF1573 domain-containing protein [Candidatus Zixiibacteriota bacterium]